MKEAIVLDIETDGDPWDGELLCLGFGDRVYYGRTPHPAVRAALADPTQPIVTHTKFDARWLRLHGWEVAGPFYDTQVMAWMLNENQDLDLDALCKRYLGYDPDKRLRRSEGRVLFRCDDGSEIPFTRVAITEAGVWDQVFDYNRRDIETTKALFEELRDLLQAGMWWDHYLTEEVPYTESLLDMECRGIPINLADNEAAHERITKAAEGLEEELLRELGYGINLGSGDQLAEVLFRKVYYQPDTIPHGLDLRKPNLIQEVVDYSAEERTKASVTNEEVEELRRVHVESVTPPGFTVQKRTHQNLIGYWTRKGLGLKKTPPTPSGKRPSTSTPDLLYHHPGHPWISKLVQYRKYEKVLSTYTKVFPEKSHGGRLYGRFNQTGTKTGRLSSSGPNLQNIPAHGELGTTIRSLFCGRLIVGDYSQLEPRLMAHFSRDPVLLDTYRTGKDIYLVTAKAVFGREVSKDDEERQIAKTLILALGYGAGAKKLAQVLSLNGYPTTAETAQGYLEELQGIYARLFTWKEEVIRGAKQRGYVKTIGGRYRRLKHQFGGSWKNIGYGERQAVNAVVQGSAGDVVRRAMLRIAAEVPEVQMLAQVHDEVVMEYQQADLRTLAALQGVCEDPGYELSVPLVFEPSFCDSWADKGGKAVEWEEEEVA